MSIAEYIFNNAENNPDLARKRLSGLEVNIETMMDFYSYLKNKMLSFSIEGSKKIFDVCGTGGSGLSRVNMSTILAITLAKKGYVIAKHANRASSGKVGSVDIMEKMNLVISNNPHESRQSMANNGYCFLFAPSFHPELKKISQIRRDIGHPTIVNFIMPLLNPISNLSGQMIGVSNYNMMKLMSEVALKEKKSIIFIHDKVSGLDDVSILGETLVIEVKNDSVNEYSIKPEDFGFERAKSFNDISGYENVKENMNLAFDIMRGEAPSQYINFLKINQMVCEKFFNNL